MIANLDSRETNIEKAAISTMEGARSAITRIITWIVNLHGSAVFVGLEHAVGTTSICSGRGQP